MHMAQWANPHKKYFICLLFYAVENMDNVVNKLFDQLRTNHNADFYQDVT